MRAGTLNGWAVRAKWFALSSWLALALALAVSGCGFELRRPPEFAFKSIFTELAPTSAMSVELQRNFLVQGNVQLITDVAQAKNAQVMLIIVQDQREKVVVGANAAGQVFEFQLRLRLKFLVRTPTGKELIPETELLLSRNLSYSEAFALAKETEEAQLYRNMQSDIVQQLMRRLAAIKEL